MPNDKRYELEERTALFGENVIALAKTLAKDIINNELVKQIVRSGTSVGANYMEADAAESKKDFRHKIAICRKAVKETKHWLRMIVKANPERKDDCKVLWTETQELTLIFSAVLSSRGNRP